MNRESLIPSSSNLPAPWRAEAQAQLAPEEKIVTWLELDLDTALKFSRGLIVATDRRLLAKNSDGQDWTSWEYYAGLTLKHQDHAGVGSLELQDGQSRLAYWRYTLAQNPQALRLINQFDQQRDAQASGQAAVEEELDVCPQCKAPIPQGQETCAICPEAKEAPPSTWALFRLTRFAKPYKGSLLLGFLLTLASTAATLVPPYMTMPLMDNVLIPFQNGAPLDSHLAGLYLSGLLGSAMVAWILGWARTYILALVSERIGADLRTTTY